MKSIILKSCLATALLASCSAVVWADKKFEEEFKKIYYKPDSEDAKEKALAAAIDKVSTKIELEDTVINNACNVCHVKGKAKKMRNEEDRKKVGDRDFLIIIPAFVVSELKEAFQIGFLLFVPFIVIDMVVANILLALGMHMLSPTTISMPFKLLPFVLVDGWYLIAKGLVIGYL